MQGAQARAGAHLAHGLQVARLGRREPDGADVGLNHAYLHPRQQFMGPAAACAGLLAQKGCMRLPPCMWHATP